MTSYLMRRQLRRSLALACLVALPALACTDTLLNVTDPDIVQRANSASAANGLLNVSPERHSSVSSPPNMNSASGPCVPLTACASRNTQDQRIWDPNNTFNAGPF